MLFIISLFKFFDKFVEHGNHALVFLLFIRFLDNFCEKTFRDMLRLFLHFHAFLGQRYDALACIFLAFGTLDQPRLLHTLQKRRDMV